ncbi:MAG: D-lyxose/D-mannose family sugar isomerase [Candidatus Promineifilaceae bacterium]|jgi:D-lyxose ketol-isomerase
MKRSEINEIISEAEAFCREHNFNLPRWAHWTLQDWQNCDDDVSEIVHNTLGWDITDFGQGKFESLGLVLFTIRNGDPKGEDKTKIYAEKLLIVDPDQVTPLHYHWKKTEDIINRSGGDLVVKLYNSTPDGGLDDTEVEVKLDGILHHVEAGGLRVLKPGDSITLVPGLYHAFWGERERVLVGEVSSVNDDAADNRFYQPVGRFPDIEEDVLPTRLLVNDYQKFL